MAGRLHALRDQLAAILTLMGLGHCSVSEGASRQCLFKHPAIWGLPSSL